jgi:hypothetical protein
MMNLRVRSLQVPNAKTLDIHAGGKPKFLLVGSTGGGKTTQIVTLPGRTFAYLFDPSALSTLRGFDVEYETFFPEKVNLSAQALAKGKGDRAVAGARKEDASEVYREWEEDFEKKLASNYFDAYDNIAFDSFTTFSDIVMDRILAINGRPGHFPQQDDWAAQMGSITNVVRTLVGMNKVLLFTAHDEFKQDEASKRMQNTLMLTGRLKVKLPLLFSEIYHMDSNSTAEKINYTAQTRADRMNPTIRCTMRDVPMFVDMTIQDWKRPHEYGLGKLLREKLGYNPSQRPVSHVGESVQGIPGKAMAPAVGQTGAGNSGGASRAP